jgi:DNA-binding transcriptional regulator YbjK
VLLHLLLASADRTHARTLLQIWAEAAREPQLAEVVEHSTRELRATIQSLLEPWFREHASRLDHPLSAASLTEAVLTAVQGFTVRLAIDPAADPDVLARHTATAFDRW